MWRGVPSAQGDNQNCGNVMTGRSSTRIHQAPGGNSSICLGEEPIQIIPPVQKPHNTSSISLGGDIPPVENPPPPGATPERHLATQFAIRDDLPPVELPPPPEITKERHLASQFVIREDLPPVELPAPPEATKERHLASNFSLRQDLPPEDFAPVQAPVEPEEPDMVPFDESDYKVMIHGELRVACRERGLSPAGGKDTLLERLCDAVKAGEVKPLMKKNEKKFGPARSRPGTAC